MLADTYEMIDKTKYERKFTTKKKTQIHMNLTKNVNEVFNTIKKSLCCACKIE